MLKPIQHRGVAAAMDVAADGGDVVAGLSRS